MKQNILVVDDEEQILSALQRTLRNQEYNVLTANNGTEALAVLEDNTVALIMSDYMMPGLSGTELLVKAEEMQPDTVRIILSGHSDFQNVMDSIKSGVVHKFLAKPWSNEVLIQQINKSLGLLEEEPAEKGEIKSDKPTAKEKAKKNNNNELSFYEIKATEDNKIIEVASELLSFFDYSAKELKDKAISTLLADHSYQQHIDFVEKRAKSSANWSAPAQARIAKTRNNTFFPIALGAKKTPEGIVYAVAALDKVKPKKTNEDKILQAISDAYLLVDQDGRIEKFNHKLTDLFGDIVSPKESELLTDFLQRCIEHEFYPEAEFDQPAWLEAFLQFDTEKEYELQSEQYIQVTATKVENGSVLLIHKIQNLELDKIVDHALADAKKAKEEKSAVLALLKNDVESSIQDNVLMPLEKLKETDLDETQQEQLNQVLTSSNSILSSIQEFTQTEIGTDKQDEDGEEQE